MVKFRDLNPATMPGYGDPETWGGRTPYREPPEDEDGEWSLCGECGGELVLRCSQCGTRHA